MAKHIYPNGPSTIDLDELKQELKFGGRHGLFINFTEFCTFSSLLEPMKPLTQGEHTANIETLSADSGLTVEKLNDAENDESVTSHTESTGSETNVTLFSMTTLSKILRDLGKNYRDKDARDQLKLRLTGLTERGCTRRLVEIPLDWSERLDKLTERYPNFLAVINHVRNECQLAAFSRPAGVRLSPILLAGEPGIGKTAFARDLARMLESGFYSYSIETAQNGSGLCGSARYWSNSQTGLIFDTLTEGESINPVFLIDELDKASALCQLDPTAAFYQLLERQQAAIFTDESIPELPIDASLITWIFTANNVARIPAPICNRLTVFDVPRPTLQQGRLIIDTLFKETVAEIALSIHDDVTLALLAHLEMSKDAIKSLSQCSVRQAKLKLRNAIANSLGKKSKIIRIQDQMDLSELSLTAGDAGLH